MRFYVARHKRCARDAVILAMVADLDVDLHS